MSDLVRFRIPAPFVLERVLPTPAELVYGYRHGWLLEPDVVSVALAAYEAGTTMPEVAEELALLLSADLGRVPDLIDELNRQLVAGDEAAGVWLFLALAWLYEHRADFLEPLEVVEMLYADFDYPDEIQDLVRFMPAPPGAASGHAAIEERWRKYLQRKATAYGKRRV